MGASGYMATVPARLRSAFAPVTQRRSQPADGADDTPDSTAGLDALYVIARAVPLPEIVRVAAAHVGAEQIPHAVPLTLAEHGRRRELARGGKQVVLVPTQE